MRVLIVTRNFPPERGGIQRLVYHMALELAGEFDVRLLAPAGSAAVVHGIRVDEIANRPLWRFFFGAARRAIHIGRSFRPAAVIAGSGLVAPFAWMAAKLAGARLLVYVHGLDIVASHVLYRWFWRPFIRAADVCVANSANTRRLAVEIGVAQERIAIVHPGVELPQTPGDAAGFRQRFDLGARPLLLSVGRLIERKGLLEFVERSLPAIVEKFPQVCLVVLGDEEPELLHGNSAGLGRRIRERTVELGLAGNILFIGPQDDEVLAAAYAAADVHVFPVRDTPGDVEGFGMVAVEAAAHGLPTVAFAVGGVPDAVRNGVSGALIGAGDYAAFAAEVNQWLAKRSDPDMRERTAHFAAQFDWRRFGQSMRDCLRNMVHASGNGLDA